MTRRSPLWRALPSEFSPRLYFGALLVLLLATILAPAHAQAQAAVSVTAPLNGDRIVPGTPFVISASATGNEAVGDVPILDADSITFFAPLPAEDESIASCDFFVNSFTSAGPAHGTDSFKVLMSCETARAGAHARARFAVNCQMTASLQSFS
jgi:hypothetical protein